MEVHCNAVLLIIFKRHYIKTLQTLVEGRKIDEDERKDAILQIISDKYCSPLDDPS
ncbi:MAG: hypothetical protein ACREAU_05780 [Nitrosopumilaceae archaeon]